MTTFKAYASRTLNDAGLDPPGRTKRWARHGSTRYIWTQRDLRDVLKYVTEEQGEPMDLYIASGLGLIP